MAKISLIKPFSSYYLFVIYINEIVGAIDLNTVIAIQKKMAKAVLFCLSVLSLGRLCQGEYVVFISRKMGYLE